MLIGSEKVLRITESCLNYCCGLRLRPCRPSSCVHESPISPGATIGGRAQPCAGQEFLSSAISPAICLDVYYLAKYPCVSFLIGNYFGASSQHHVSVGCMNKIIFIGGFAGLISLSAPLIKLTAIPCRKAASIVNVSVPTIDRRFSPTFCQTTLI